MSKPAHELQPDTAPAPLIVHRIREGQWSVGTRILVKVLPAGQVEVYGGQVINGVLSGPEEARCLASALNCAAADIEQKRGGA